MDCPVALAAAVAAAFAAFTGAGTAEAACASFWGMGNIAQCHSEVGSFAIVTHDTGSAMAVGIGGAISVGGGNALSGGLFTAALASRVNTNATATGTGSLAQDVGNDQNTGSAATAVGWFNRALNYGNDNWPREQRSPAHAGPGDRKHRYREQHRTELGNGNVGRSVRAAGCSRRVLRRVYQFGDGNVGVSPGAVSNLIQVGSDNGIWPTKDRPVPNTAVGLFTTNTVRNRNVSNAGEHQRRAHGR